MKAGTRVLLADARGAERRAEVAERWVWPLYLRIQIALTASTYHSEGTGQTVRGACYTVRGGA